MKAVRTPETSVWAYFYKTTWRCMAEGIMFIFAWLLADLFKAFCTDSSCYKEQMIWTFTVYILTADLWGGGLDSVELG
jgi:hypothetical protein